jgi:hypothetical protein
MKRTLLIVLLLACGLQPSGPALCQTAQTRMVKGQTLTSSHLPSIRLKFQNRFKYVGMQKFVLYERAQVEQYFFVDADKRGRITHMYMVQFEGYLPGVDATYDYPATETATLGGQTYIVNAETVPSVSAVIKQRPESDVAHAVSFLAGKGFRPSESIRYQRFVRLVDEAKRNELILIYIEDTGAGASSASDKLGKEFLARAMKGFTILN